MKAVVQYTYGPPEVLEVREIEPPAIGDDGVLIRVHAASVNAYDWHMMTGKPYLARLQGGLRRPKRQVPGVDVAGTVEAVGRNVTEFRPGDEVWGTCGGAYAEYARATEERLVLKPANATFEQAAAMPIAAITALQGLRDHGHVQAGQEVLINGASGGVGTFAVQISKSLGAHVTGVCSTRNVESARSIGAEHVIDYTREDFTRAGQRYDLILDIAGNHSMRAIRRVLVPAGIYVGVGSAKIGDWVGPLIDLLKVKLASIGRSQQMGGFLAAITKEDLTVLQGLLQAGDVSPVIDRRYELGDTAEALRRQGEGHAQGKQVIVVRG
ncbi:MAG: NAD(P)-dependent alcohol dehydrogenase [Actinomycetota bacterium]